MSLYLSNEYDIYDWFIFYLWLWYPFLMYGEVGAGTWAPNEFWLIGAATVLLVESLAPNLSESSPLVRFSESLFTTPREAVFGVELNWGVSVIGSELFAEHSHLPMLAVCGVEVVWIPIFPWTSLYEQQITHQNSSYWWWYGTCLYYYNTLFA